MTGPDGPNISEQSIGGPMKLPRLLLCLEGLSKRMLPPRDQYIQTKSEEWPAMDILFAAYNAQPCQSAFICIYNRGYVRLYEGVMVLSFHGNFAFLGFEVL